MLNNIFTKYPASAWKCDKAAELVKRAFVAVGQNPQMIRIMDKSGARWFFLKDGKTLFGKDFEHQAVLVNGRVYDALTGKEG